MSKDETLFHGVLFNALFHVDDTAKEAFKVAIPGSPIGAEAELSIPLIQINL
jgi:hypothetical protein